MNIGTITKCGARLGVSALFLGILAMPVQVTEPIPVPHAKPSAGMLKIAVPVPAVKPNVQVAQKNDRLANKSDNAANTLSFKAMSLKLASLFATPAAKAASQTERNTPYPHDYTPITAADSKLYARIFEAQALGQMEKADSLIASLKDERLMGHVLYQRYMHASYRSSYAELKQWMASYADHPKANKIYTLALSRQKGAAPKKPQNGPLLSQVNEPTIYYAKRYATTMKRSRAQAKQVSSLFRKIRRDLRRGKALDALVYFRQALARDYMDTVEHDMAQTEIAKGLLYARQLDDALKLARQSADRSGQYVPEAAWVTGLALWQKGQYATAAPYFDQAGTSEYASGWLASAGSYWAARSYKKAGNAKAERTALENASVHSRTFYGLLAIKAMGERFDFDWQVPDFTRQHEAQLLSHAAGQRAFLLVAAGQYNLAEEEMMRLRYRGNPDLRRAALAYASHVGLPGVALRLGNMVQGEHGKYYDSALYPISPWAPKDGYKVDPALVQAVIRQESRFNLNAVSYSGAVGLMQVMPKTAQYVAKTHNYDDEINDVTMALPETNMKIGQDYISYLLNGRYVKGNVVDLLVSYNAGPGNMLKWRKRMKGNSDPLLFIEMLPVQETRDYVERVLSNYWIYRMRAGLKAPSLTALAKGQAPKYAHAMQAGSAYKLAAR